MKASTLAKYIAIPTYFTKINNRLTNKLTNNKAVKQALCFFFCLLCIPLLSACFLQNNQTNTAPTVRIISPKDTEILNTSSLRINIEAQDTENNLANIKLYENGELLGEASRTRGQEENHTQDTSLPERWHFNWTAPQNGSYTLSTEATDHAGLKSTSSVSFEVDVPIATPPAAPTDSIAFEIYAANLALWQQQNINTYMIDIQRICFCLPDITRPVKLSVENNTLSEAVYLSGAAVNQENYSQFHTINKAFSLIQEAFEADAAEIRVVYDDVYGFPINVFIDYDQRLADEELQLKYSNFTIN